MSALLRSAENFLSDPWVRRVTLIAMVSAYVLGACVTTATWVLLGELRTSTLSVAVLLTMVFAASKPK